MTCLEELSSHDVMGFWPPPKLLIKVNFESLDVSVARCMFYQVGPYALALLLFKHGLGTGYGGEFFVFFRSVLP